MKIADSGRKYIKLFQQPDAEFYVFETEQRFSKKQPAEEKKTSGCGKRLRQLKAR